MKATTSCVLFLAALVAAPGEVLAEGPEGPAAEADGASSSLARLVSEGSGVIEFEGTVYYEAERKPAADEGEGPVLVARGRNTFPFKRGRYHAPDMGVDVSRTLISYTPDGWLEIRREGKARVLLVPPAKVAQIQATLPEEDAKDAPGPGKVGNSVHLRFVPVAEVLTVLQDHHPELAPGVEGLDLSTNQIRLAADFARGEELRTVLARLDARGTQVVLELEVRMPGPDGKPKVVAKPVVTVTDGGVARISSGTLEMDIKAKVLRPDAKE